MKKIEKMTKKALVAAVEAENLGTFRDGKNVDRTPGITGIAQTENGNYMVYSVNGANKLYNTSVHANRREANGMALLRLRKMAQCQATLLAAL